MKILIFGSGGQLGYELVRQGRAHNLDIYGIDYPQTDITDMSRVSDVFSQYQPLVVVNAAAYTNVDLAESEPDRATAINRDGPANVAQLCAQNKIPLIHISTDYVFDGTKGSPYRETDPVSPIGAYGKSKADGETALRAVLNEHIILRTAWLYGTHGENFVKTILKLARKNEKIQVVCDQFGCPTCAADLAEAILTIVEILSQRAAVDWGTYHYCGRGITSWHEFAQAIVDICRRHETVKTKQIDPINTADYPTKAARPKYSALDCGLIYKHFGISTKPWLQSLETTIRDLTFLNIKDK